QPRGQKPVRTAPWLQDRYGARRAQTSLRGTQMPLTPHEQAPCPDSSGTDLVLTPYDARAAEILSKKLRWRRHALAGNALNHDPLLTWGIATASLPPG